MASAAFHGAFLVTQHPQSAPNFDRSAVLFCFESSVKLPIELLADMPELIRAVR